MRRSVNQDDEEDKHFSRSKFSDVEHGEHVPLFGKYRLSARLQMSKWPEKNEAKNKMHDYLFSLKPRKQLIVYEIMQMLSARRFENQLRRMS